MRFQVATVKDAEVARIASSAGTWARVSAEYDGVAGQLWTSSSDAKEIWHQLVVKI